MVKPLIKSYNNRRGTPLAKALSRGITGKPFMGGITMFQRDGLFTKKAEELRKDVRTPLSNPHVNPIQGGARPPQAEPPKPEAPKPEAAPSPARTGEAQGSKLIVGPDIS